MKIDRLETWLVQENKNPNSVVVSKSIKNIYKNDDNNISILCGISHLINTHAKSLMECSQDLGYPPSITIESYIPISTTLYIILTYASPLMTTSTQISTPRSVGLPNLLLPVIILPISIAYSLPLYNVVSFTYSNPL